MHSTNDSSRIPPDSGDGSPTDLPDSSASGWPDLPDLPGSSDGDGLPSWLQEEAPAFDPESALPDFPSFTAEDVPPEMAFPSFTAEAEPPPPIPSFEPEGTPAPSFADSAPDAMTETPVFPQAMSAEKISHPPCHEGERSDGAVPAFAPVHDSIVPPAVPAIPDPPERREPPQASVPPPPPEPEPEAGDPEEEAWVRSEHAIAISRKGPGQPAGYGITVRNTRTHTIYEFTITHQLPEDCHLIDAQPAALQEGRTLLWRFGQVEPGVKIQVRAKAAPQPGEELPERGTFGIAYRITPPQAKPCLTIQTHGPSSARVGELVPLRIEVRNEGTVPAEGAACQLTLPAELSGGIGEAPRFPLGTLGPGACTYLHLQLSAKSAGQFVCRLAVESSLGQSAPATWTIQALEPQLRIQIAEVAPTSPGDQTAGQIHLCNEGNASAENIEVRLVFPEEARPLSAQEGGHCTPSERKIVWHLKSLAAGASRALAYTWRAELPGDVTLRAEVFQADRLQDETTTRATIVIAADSAGGVLEELLGAIDAEMGSRLSEAPTQNRVSQYERSGERYLVFTLAGIDYAIPLENVLEAGSPPPVAPVPHVPEWVVGVTNLRGDVVSLVDLRGFLGLEAEAGGNAHRLLVVKTRQAELTIGLLVDRLRGIHALPQARLTGADALGESPITPFVRGITEEAGRVVVFLDLDQLLLSAEMRQFEAGV